MEKRYQWLPKPNYAGTFTPATIRSLQSAKEALPVLVMELVGNEIYKVQLFPDCTNKLIDLLGADENAWVGRKIIFNVSKKGDKHYFQVSSLG